MPSGKLIAWIVGLSLATTLAMEHYRAKQATATGKTAKVGILRTA